jgi:hypothetical protein
MNDLPDGNKDDFAAISDNVDTLEQSASNLENWLEQLVRTRNSVYSFIAPYFSSTHLKFESDSTRRKTR